VALTEPTLAATMARHGPGQVTLPRARLAAGPTPTGVLDLSDAALKAMCDQTSWLLGSPSERTQRELVQRDVRQAGTDGLRERLADSDRHASTTPSQRPPGATPTWPAGRSVRTRQRAT
jgi:hypothetical protein